jgi:alpha-tubulin suppressor-like RCC1 family protein
MLMTRLFCSIARLCTLVLLTRSEASATDGWIVGWGDNLSGQVNGTPTRVQTTGVVWVAGCVVSNAAAVAVGSAHCLARTIDNKVLAWGWNHAGQVTGLASEPEIASGPVLIAGKPLQDVTRISAADEASLALRRNGTIVGWGAGPTVSAPAKVTAIAAGYRHCLGLTNGVVFGWGPFGGPREQLSNIVAIAASQYWAGHDLALCTDGTVLDWDNRAREPSPVPGLSNAAAISSGSGHRLALRADGTVFGWGANGFGEALGFPTKIDPADAAGTNGTVMLAGSPLTNVIAISAGYEFSLALKRDGNITAWGRWHMLDTVPVPTGLSNVVAIAAGHDFCLAVTTNRLVAQRFGGK